MNFTVYYFGLFAELRGLSQESLSSSATTPAALYAELNAAHSLGLAINDFRAAVNDEFVSWDHPLSANDTIALLPPMSGG